MNRKELIKKADEVFSKWIRKRDFGRCFTCGSIYPISDMDNGHFVPRDCMPLRYDEKNCHAQCKQCNQFKGGEPKAYRRALVEKYGEETVKAMERRRYEIRKFTDKELENIIKKYA